MKPLRIVIFAKAPRPGFAKTRLRAALGEQGAADLARRLLIHTVRRALVADIGVVELCAAPSIKDEAWPEEVRAAIACWTEQREGDLGDRLARAAKRVIDSGQAVLLIGTDCPALTPARLKQAARSLQRHDAVMFPTHDGGYALLGLNSFDPSLFSDISWSSNVVAIETKRRLAGLGWRLKMLSVLHDIDEPADLRWLPKGLAG